MNHGGAFSGIGGFELAAHWMGWNNLFHCELNQFGQQILKYYWSNSISYGDITTTDFSIHRGQLDIFTGGFPCQDASIANQHGDGQQGLDGSRTGLWTHMVRAIKESNPKYVVAENVANILKVNGGRDFTTILTELSRMGYNAEWRVCRASEVGAPHHRARLYMVAYPDSIRLQKTESFFAYMGEAISQERRNIAGTDAQVGVSWGIEPSVCCMDDGLPSELGKKPFSKWRTEAIKAYGNAIVPQVAYNIFRGIETIESQYRLAKK